MLKRTFKSKGEEMWKKLYTSYVRPQLEFAIPVWNPFSERDINTLERVQRRETKVAHTLKRFNYLNAQNYQLKRETNWRRFDSKI